MIWLIVAAGLTALFWNWPKLLLTLLFALAAAQFMGMW